jgi:Zn finger protein HypA/HybF involved in hydrogenase expression
MHEFGVTEAIVKGLLDQLQREKVAQVAQLRFRRSSAFSEEVLRQTFAALSPGTPLAGAMLMVEVLMLHTTCMHCGQTNEINSDDLVGHMFICPTCGAIKEIAEAHDLELVEVIAESRSVVDA